MDDIYNFFNGSAPDTHVTVDGGGFQGGYAATEGLLIDEEADDFLRVLRHRLGYPLPERNECYDLNTSTIIQVIYILATVLWIIFIYWFAVYERSDIVMWFFFIIPPLVYLTGYLNVCNVTFASEDDVLGANYLSFGFLITIILINWNNPLSPANKNKFFKLLVLAFVLIMLSMIDVWVGRRNMSIVRHIRTMLQTAALVILSMSLYIYYRYQEDAIRKNAHMSEEDLISSPLEKST